MEKTEKINLIEVGRRVREARKDRGLTGKQLGAMIARSQNTISKIERGLNSATPDNIRRIAMACDVSEDYLWLRTDYKTDAEALRASVKLMQSDDAMWRAFFQHIAICEGYEMSVADRSGVDPADLDAPYLLFDVDGDQKYLSISETEKFVRSVRAHVGLTLKMMLDQRRD